MKTRVSQPKERFLRHCAWIVALAAVVLFGPPAAVAAPDDPWDARFYANGTNIGGSVNAVAVSGGNVYVGGLFSSMFGVYADNIARWDGSTWSALGSGTGGGGGNPAVYALAVSGSDVYVGGAFSIAGGGTANRIAKWDGSAWSSLGTGMNGNVRALAVLGSTVYAGGEFTTAGGSTANRIAQWDGATWSALGTGMNSTVNVLAVSGATVYAGGDFTTAGGSTANRIAQWDGAAWASLGTGMNERVLALTVNGADLYAGGFFTSAGGGGANRVARWDGAAWSALGSGINFPVLALAVAGGELYAEGGFTNAGGTPVNNIARWNGASWSAVGTGVNMNNASGALAASGTDLYVGGQFYGAGSTAAMSFARWNGSAWSLVTTTAGAGLASSGFYPGVRALARSSSGDLYATGVFEFAGATPAISIAKFDGTGWSALGTGLAGPTYANYGYGFGQALAFYGGDLYVGGNFTTAGGVSVFHIARWNGTTFTALGGGIGGGFGQHAVNALIEYNGELYVGGSFTTVGAYIARWNGTSWSTVGSGMNGTVHSFAVIGSDLYVGGDFSTAGGGSALNVARWNGTTWSALGGGAGIGSILALAAVGSDLYAGGQSIRKWDGSTWSSPGGGICFGCGFGGQAVRGLATIGNDLYVTGSFEHVGTGGGQVTVWGTAKWNGVSWSALGSGSAWSCVGSSCPFYSSAGPVLTAGTDVYVGGRFTSAGSKPAAFISIWHTCGNGVVDPNEQCDDGNTTSGDCCSSTCQYEAGGGACADDGNPCTNDQCNGAGGCAHPPNTAPCTDGMFCNGSDSCSGGTCSQHAGNPCPGDNTGPSCTDSCTEAGGGSCTANDSAGTGCSDGLFCTVTDTCDGAGACVGSGNPCPGHNVGPNCNDSCTEAGGGSCTAADASGTSCADGLFCNGADTCSGGTCTVHASDPCTTGSQCADACNESADNCFDLSGTPCMPDGELCTEDECNGAGTCAHPAGNAGTECRADAGQCDVAEQCNGSSPTCPPDSFEPNTTSCSDGSVCTQTDLCNGAGTCVGSNLQDCDDGNICTADTCHPLNGCENASAPATGCKTALKAKLSLKQDGGAGDKQLFKWIKGAALSQTELDDPTATTEYAVCLYTGINDDSLESFLIPAAGGNWSPIGDKGYKYKELTGSYQGLTTVLLKGSAIAGKSKVLVKGQGPNLPDPALANMPLPLTAQVINLDTGVCVEATFDTPNVLTNTSTLFKAKTP